MALENVIKEAVPSFDLGIENSQVFGNLQAADAFLSETAAVTSDPEKIEDKNTPPKVEPKKVEVKTEEAPDANLLADSFLSGDDKDEPVIPKDKVEVKDIKSEILNEGENEFEVLSKELYKTNIFTKDEGEEEVIAKTPEEFRDLFLKEKERGAQTWLENFLSKFGDDRRELFEAIYINGVDPTKYLPVFNEVLDFENLDLTEESNQESVVRTYLKEQNYTQVEIDKRIEKLKGYSDLEEEANIMHPKLVQKNKDKLTQQAEAARNREASLQAADVEYKTGLSKLLQEKVKAKDLKGIPLTEADATKIYDNLYNKKWKTQSGELLTDFDKAILESKKPENFEARAIISYLFLNNFDFSKIAKKAISTESNELFKGLKHKEIKKTQTQPNNSSW